MDPFLGTMHACIHRSIGTARPLHQCWYHHRQLMRDIVAIELEKRYNRYRHRYIGVANPCFDNQSSARFKSLWHLGGTLFNSKRTMVQKRVCQQQRLIEQVMPLKGWSIRIGSDVHWNFWMNSETRIQPFGLIIRLFIQLQIKRNNIIRDELPSMQEITTFPCPLTTQSSSTKSLVSNQSDLCLFFFSIGQKGRCC